MSYQWRGQAVHQTCPYHSPGWKTSSTQTLALSIFFLYNPQCCCCCYVCHSSIKGPWHPVPCSTFLYEPAGSSMPRPPNPPPLPTMPFINRWWKWWWKRCYKDRGAPVLCLSIKQNSLFYCYIAIFWQYHGLGTISIGSPLPCECFQRWHWQNSLMILSLTPSLPPSYSQCWWWKTQNLSRDFIDRNIDRTSIYLHIYLSIYISTSGVCLYEAGTWLKGIDSRATFGRDGAMNIAPAPHRLTWIETSPNHSSSSLSPETWDQNHEIVISKFTKIAKIAKLPNLYLQVQNPIAWVTHSVTKVGIK